MNILLIGGAGVLMSQFINKLKKERHRIFLLTGKRYNNQDYEKKVFERYNFTYDSGSMNEIFESVRPDVVLFLGAFDTNFTWVDEQKDSVKFTSSLLNLLSAFSMGQYGRFVYLSSSEVYAGDFPEDITEETETNADRYRGMAIAQGEAICKSYRDSRKLDIVCARLDHLDMIPSRRREVEGICAQMCLSALENNRIKANGNHRFSLLYTTDAVEYIYRLMVSDSHRHYLYHISSSEEISELELAELIRDAARVAPEIVEVDDWNAREILSNQRFDDEFGLRIFHHGRDIAAKMMSHMERNKKAFLQDEEKRDSFGKRVADKLGWMVHAFVPFLENMFCFVIFFMLNNRAVGSEYFSQLDFYLLYVLLFAIIYGQQQAIVSAVLAVAGYLFRQMYNRTGFEVMMDYNTYVWVAQLFILGLVVGYMRDRLNSMKAENEEKEEFLTYRLGDITEINQSNVRVKDVLETQIVNNNDSIGKIYNITSKLEQYTPEEVLFYAAEMVSQLMNSKDVAIYTVSNNDFARLASSTSKTARRYGHSIRYRQMDELSKALLERKVYINRSIDRNFPHMANAIYDEGRMQLIIMVWGISWEQMTLGQANLLTVISLLIQNAVLRANRYMVALEDKRYVDGNRVLEQESFVSLVNAFWHAMDRGLTECTLLWIHAQENDYRHAGEVLEKNLRQADYLGTLKDGRLYALLANTSVKDAQIVVSRFAECGYASEIVEEVQA